jgi:uncharacterized protein YlzI (FlbEa/FlbD family)
MSFIAMNRALFLRLVILIIVTPAMLVSSNIASKAGNQRKRSKDDKVSNIVGLELKLDDDEPSTLDFKQISSNQLLVTISNTIYMVNAKKEIVWKNDVDLVKPPIIDSKGGIYGITSDLGHFSINAQTGEVDYFGRGVGGSHSYYTDIKLYKGNQYLVVESMQYYRDGNLCYPKCPMSNDNLYAWEGKRLLWQVEFPPKADLQVWGDKILAINKNSSSVVIKEIEKPKQ